MAITKENFLLLMKHAPDISEHTKSLKFQVNVARLKISFALLWFLGARVNEVGSLSGEEIYSFIKTRKLLLKLHKVSRVHEVTLSKKGQEYLQTELKEDLKLVFDICNLPNLKTTMLKKNIKAKPVLIKLDNGEEIKKYTEPVTQRQESNVNLGYIKFLNDNIRTILSLFDKDITNLSSHSFRISKINRLLKQFPLEITSLKMGHSNIETTFRYSRDLVTEEDREKLELIDDLG